MLEIKNLASYAIKSVYNKIDPNRKQNCFEVRKFMAFLSFIDIRVRFYDRSQF